MGKFGERQHLASTQQLGEEGSVIAGEGSSSTLRAADRLVRTYGGKISDWVKKSSTAYRARNYSRIQTRWYENTATGCRVEQKTNIYWDRAK